jgi:hypothetical protein
MKAVRKSILAAVCAAGVLSAGASQVWARAQLAPTAPAEAGSTAPTDVEVLQALNSKAIEIALGTQPIAADQLALGSRFVAAMNLRAALDGLVSEGLAPTRAQILQGMTNAPPEKKAKFMAAVDEALAGVRRDMLNQVINGVNRYYAARLTAAQLKDALGFYESPLGQKAVRTPAAMTEAETQEAGQYALDHPAIFEILGAASGSMEASRVLSERATASMGERFKVRLCAALKTRALESAACAKA